MGLHHHSLAMNETMFQKLENSKPKFQKIFEVLKFQAKIIKATQGLITLIQNFNPITRQLHNSHLRFHI